MFSLLGNNLSKHRNMIVGIVSNLRAVSLTRLEKENETAALIFAEKELLNEQQYTDEIVIDDNSSEDVTLDVKKIKSWRDRFCACLCCCGRTSLHSDVVVPINVEVTSNHSVEKIPYSVGIFQPCRYIEKIVII